jgi:putative MATE family efflux protein
MAEDEAVRRVTEGPLWWGVLRFGLPLVAGMALYTSFNLVDMFMISRIENAKAALGALGICDMVAALPTIISNGISTSTVAVIARRLGEGDRGGAAFTACQSMVLVCSLSVVFGLMGWFGSDLMIRDLIQAKGEVASLASRYLQVMIGGAYSIFLLLQVTAILRAYGRAKSAAALLVGGNALNLFLNMLLVFGPGPHPPLLAWVRPIALTFDVPRMGLQGTAYATLVARTLPVMIGLLVLIRVIGGAFEKEQMRPNKEMLIRLVRLGWPSSAQLVIRIGAILVLFALINASYTTADDAHTLTAYSICLRLETLILFLGMGWGAAASSFMGMNLGAEQKRRAHASGWITAVYNALLTLAMAWAFVHFAQPIIGFFEGSPEVIEAGRTYLATVAPSYIAVAVGVVLSQALTGAGATFASFAVDTAGLVLFAIPAAIVTVVLLHASPSGLWTTIALGNVACAVAFAIYYARGRFLEKRV